MKKFAVVTCVIAVGVSAVLSSARAQEASPPPAIPADVLAGASGHPAAFLLRVLPQNQSNSEPVPAGTVVQGTGSLGAVVQSNTGLGLQANGRVRVTTTNEDGASTGFAVGTDVVVGSTVPGQTQLPTLRVDGRHFWGHEVPAPGRNAATNIYVGGNFDRNVAMDRLWSLTGYAGIGSVSTDSTARGSRALELFAQGELGAGQTGEHILPFIQLRGGASYEECIRVGSGSGSDPRRNRHQLCGAVQAGANLGLLQLGLDLSARGEYRYRIEDENGDAKAVLFAGPHVGAGMQLDLNGVHGAGTAGIGLGVRVR